MTMPNFLVIGAAKSGTDSLCNYLGQHPDIYIPGNREPNFFVSEGRSSIPYAGRGDRAALVHWDMWVSTIERYQSLFDEVTTEQAIGEGTTWYIYDEAAPARIRRYIPHAKLVAILRNPVDRAYSAYTMLLRDGREDVSDFLRALAAEEDRIRRNWEPMWHYVHMGLYAAQLRRYYETFSSDQIRVVVYDDFNVDPVGTTKDLYRFLEVDDRFTPDTSMRYNVSQIPRIASLHSLVAGQHPVKTVLKAILPGNVRQSMRRSVMERNLTRPAPMEPAVRRELVGVFRSDILELQEMIGRNLSAWLR